MTEKITVQTASFEEAEKVHRQIPEFTPDYLKRFFSEKYNEKKHVILVAAENNQSAGYLIAYDRFNDGSIYCWCFAVKPEYRQHYVLKELMGHFESWSTQNGFEKIKVKTENRFKAALAYYIKNDYKITALTPNENIEKSEIWMEKKL